jgi:hypothetical protein
MRVKIVSCSGDAYWYADQIGQIFIVVPFNSFIFGQCYRIPNSKEAIQIQDCEIVEA